MLSWLYLWVNIEVMFNYAFVDEIIYKLGKYIFVIEQESFHLIFLFSG